MGFGRRSLNKRQFEMRMKEKVKEVETKVTNLFEDEAKVLCDIELIDGEMKMLQSKISTLKIKRQVLEAKYSKIVQKHYGTRLKQITKAAKDLAPLCPACSLNHTQDPPEACYLIVHKAGYESPLAKDFDAYLKKNKWGKLFS